MRRAAQVDVNQKEIVAAMRQIGASVQLLHAVGEGCPDLLVGFRGTNVLLEVKNRNKDKGAAAAIALTAAQETWHGGWCGQVSVVTDKAEALNAVVLAAQGRRFT